MKKLLILLSLSFSLAASAQVDPAFTAKMINVVNTAKNYYLNQTQQNLQLAEEAVQAFVPTTNAQFSSKLQAMFNSATEMAKFSSPVSFVQCLGVAAGQYNSCLNNLIAIENENNHTETQNIPPTTEPCNTNYQTAIIQCAITHLAH